MNSWFIPNLNWASQCYPIIEQGGGTEAVGDGHKVVKCPEVWMSREEVTEEYRYFLEEESLGGVERGVL